MNKKYLEEIIKDKTPIQTIVSIKDLPHGMVVKGYVDNKLSEYYIGD